MSTTIYVEKPVTEVVEEYVSLVSKLSVRILESDFKIAELQASINDEMTLGSYKQTMAQIHQLEKEIKVCYDLKQLYLKN